MLVFGAGFEGGSGVKKGLAALAAGVTLVAGGLGIWTALERAGPVATAQTMGATPVVPVSVSVVTAEDVPVFLHGIGTVQALNTATVKSRVDGPIVGVDFTEGQETQAGAALIQIDPRPYQAALAQAQAAKAKDAAQLESAEADLERYSKLVVHGFQTRQSYDQQKALVAQLKAAIAGDQAQIETAQLNLDYTQIRAPISGRLGSRLVDIGNLVRASDGTPLVTITQTRPIFVSFTLPQQSLDDIREQQMKAPLTVEALSGDDMRELAHGELTLIDNSIDPATGTIHLKAQFSNENERLWPGEFVNVRVVLSIRRAVPTVPSPTVQEGPDGYVVYVVEPDDTVARRQVEVATIQDGVAAVTKGLAPGERVVVNGQYRLTDGARISAVSPGPSATGR
jgi:membrane fusion protein, multidrug efflux system